MIKKKRYIDGLKKSVVGSNKNVVNLNGVYDARKYNFSLSESRVYSFPKNDYHEYINTWEGYQPRLENNKYSNISDDKLLFSAVMRNYVEVPEVYAYIRNGFVQSVCNEDITEDNLYDFFLSNSGGVIKARDGYNGFDVFVFGSDNNSLTLNENPISREEFLAIIKKSKNSLVQNRVEQGAFANSLYDKSVNTIRIISMQKKDAFEHEIVAAVQRIGSSRTRAVDNFSQGGVCARIDVETGIMSSLTYIDSFDESGERIFYSDHPDSKAQVEGVAIPHWEEVKEKIIEITRKLPLFHFVAWDIVLKDDGIAIIEINMKSGLSIFQVHGGMRNQLLGRKYAEHGYLVDEDLMNRRKGK